MEKKEKRGNFSGGLGFVMAAAGSAVGLGNIWRFPYLAAKDGGGIFLLFYIILTVSFGFTMLTTEIAIGRHTRQGPLTAYTQIDKRFGFIGLFACLIPAIILPYYCAIGGWVLKYLSVYLTGQGTQAAEDGYFVSFISGNVSPLIWMLIFLAVTSLIIASGVEKGIEKYSKIMMPTLFVLIIAISIYSLTLHHTDAEGVTRTGMEGLKVYIIPDFTGMTMKSIFSIMMDAMGQLFYSISVAMGIMVAYGSYAKKETNLMSSINQIEFFDTLVAFLAGLMIIPAVFTFMGREGMSAGPGLMFVSLAKVFHAMGVFGNVVGAIFFIMVTFAALTSSVSIMEAVVASFMDKFHMERKKCVAIISAYALIVGTIVCLGYNVLYFEVTLPNGSIGQILDVLDYISNNCLMPLLAFFTCILIGWVKGPKIIIDEITQGQHNFSRKWLYVVMIKVIAPVLLCILLIQSLGIM